MKVALILSGAGYLDGAEIRESVLSLLYLDQHNIQVDMFAPDMPQMHVVDHLAAEPEEGNRNVLKEAARIARGQVRALSELDMANYDGLVLPGGFGVAKNLSDFVTRGPDCDVLPDCKSAIIGCVEQSKPLAAICIAPAVVAAALKGHTSATLTIGDDQATAEAIEACGSTHQQAATTDCVIDQKNHIVSCSAYMGDASIADVAAGIEKAIQAFADILAASTSKQVA